MNIPQHVAIILDGNGRWAKSKGMPRNYGHVRGAKNLEKICRDAYDIGIKYLTVYLFSTENWKRSREEVDGLMKLFRSYTKTCIKTARENNMKVRVLGDPTALADDLQESLKELVESSKNNTGLNFNLAINYGSRDEIVRAIRQLSQDCVDGAVKPEDITEDLFSAYLDTREIPDPDLLIRTSNLKGTMVEGAVIPTLIDEIPMIAVMAVFADGTTVIRDAQELKVKESDRITVMVENLKRMGADIEGTDDGMIIHGGKPLHGATIDSHLDHRVAMSFAVAGTICDGSMEILHGDCVKISYPNFYQDLYSLGDK